MNHQSQQPLGPQHHHYHHSTNAKVTQDPQLVNSVSGQGNYTNNNNNNNANGNAAGHHSSKQAEQKQVDVLVIGGGPAALGLLVNAVKTNRLNELLQGDGLAVIEAGLNFGGGILGNYGINSNTSGGGFLKCTFKKTQKVKQDKNNQEDNHKKPNDKKGNGKQKGNKAAASAADNILQNPYAQNLTQSQKHFIHRDEQETLAPYKELFNSNIAKVLKEFGKNTAPLSLIGHFLNYAGNHLLSFIYQTTKKKIFYPLHKAVSIQLMQNGEILTKVKKQQLEITQTEEGDFVRIVETDQVIVFRSKAIVVANGGVQGIHPDLFNWFPFLDPNKVISSDQFLRSQGYLSKMREINEKRHKKVVIIGGSHSGFSCAWMLLNGPATYYKNNAGIQIDKTPFAQRKYAKNCPDCCHCGIQLQNIKKTKLNQNATGQGNQFSPAGKNLNQQNTMKCDCMCICFGLFDYDDWQFDYSQIPDWEDFTIEILYRDHIRVFYNRVTDAEFDGYTEFEAEKFSKKDGYLYSFTGLRGDAKELYLRIMRGQETRVKLIQAVDAQAQTPYVETADLVIWACGYQTNKIPFKDTDRKKLQLSQKVPNTQYDVDGKCRIMLADSHVLAKCFACGIAYPVRTKDGMVASNPQLNNPRADSFSLYMNFVGDNILKSLLPKNKIMKNSIHKILPNKKGAIEGSEAQLSKNQYNQIVRQRIHQYRNKNQDIIVMEDKYFGDKQQLHLQQQQVLRHKSLNVREDTQNKMVGKQQKQKSMKKNKNTTDHEKQNINKQKQQNAQVEIANENNEKYEDENEEAYDQDTNEDEYENNIVQGQPNNNENAPVISKDSLAIQVVETRQQSSYLNGSKSVDRAKNGSFQNKLSQMARSPQILQKKQQIMKMKNNANTLLSIYAENQQLNQDIMPILNSGENQHQKHLTQKSKKTIKPGQHIQHNTKSPYNGASAKYARQDSKLKASTTSGTSLHNRQGRDMIRSSQAGRKFDQMNQQSNDPPLKINRNFMGGGSVGVHHKQTTNRASMHGTNGGSNSNHGNQIVFNNQLYSSIGTAGAQVMFGYQQTFESNTQRQHQLSTNKKTEFPPIVNPMSQNHLANYHPLNQTQPNHTQMISDKPSGGSYSMNTSTPYEHQKQSTVENNQRTITEEEYYFEQQQQFRQISISSQGGVGQSNGYGSIYANNNGGAYADFNYEYEITQENGGDNSQNPNKQGQKQLRNGNQDPNQNQVLYVNDDCLSDDEWGVDHDISFEKESPQKVKHRKHTAKKAKSHEKQNRKKSHGQDLEGAASENDSHYDDQNFENEDDSVCDDYDPVREDVSSEGSCVNNSSYLRNKSKNMTEYEDEDDQLNNASEDSFEIPDEEKDEQASPKRDNAITNKDLVAMKAMIISDTNTRKTEESKTSQAQSSQLQSSSHKSSILQQQYVFDQNKNLPNQQVVTQAYKQHQQKSFKPLSHYIQKPGNLVTKNHAKEQLSPVLQERKNSKRIINNQSSNQKDIVKESRDDLMKEIENPTQGNLKKNRFLNPSVNHQNVNQSQDTCNRPQPKNYNNSIRQRQSKSIKQTATSSSHNNPSNLDGQSNSISHNNHSTNTANLSKVINIKKQSSYQNNQSVNGNSNSISQHLRSSHNLGSTFKQEKKYQNLDDAFGNGGNASGQRTPGTQKSINKFKQHQQHHQAIE